MVEVVRRRRENPRTSPVLPSLALFPPRSPPPPCERSTVFARLRDHRVAGWCRDLNGVVMEMTSRAARRAPAESRFPATTRARPGPDARPRQPDDPHTADLPAKAVFLTPDRGDRMDQRIGAYSTWGDPEELLRPPPAARRPARSFGGPLAATEPGAREASRNDVCTGPATPSTSCKDVPRDLALGRVLPCLPRTGPSFGRHRAGGAESSSRSLRRYEANRALILPARARSSASASAGVPRRRCGLRSFFGPVAAGGRSEGAGSRAYWDILNGRPAPPSRAPPPALRRLSEKLRLAELTRSGMSVCSGGNGSSQESGGRLLPCLDRE